MPNAQLLKFDTPLSILQTFALSATVWPLFHGYPQMARCVVHGQRPIVAEHVTDTDAVPLTIVDLRLFLRRPSAQNN